MPGLIIAGRRWNLSSDDLPIPIFLESTLRVIWLVCLVVSYFNIPSTFDTQCFPKVRLLICYLIGLQLFQIVILAINVAMVHLAVQGTVLWEAPRKGVHSLLFLRTALFLPEIGWHVLGRVWSHLAEKKFPNPYCHLHPFVTLVHNTTNVGAVLLLVILIGVFVVFDPAGSVKHLPSNENVDDDLFGRLFINPTEKARKKSGRNWLRRIKLMFCCVSFDTGSRDAYRDVSELFSGWFNDIDVVPSDLFCAVILLRQKQKRLRQATGHTSENKAYPLTPFSSLSVITNQPQNNQDRPAAWMTPHSALHYMRFAWGSYGWPAFFLTHLCTGFCVIWKGVRCFSCMRSPVGLLMRGDNCCECHTATLRTLAKVPKNDLLMISFKNSLYKIPFFVCYDHSTQSVVLVVRGTLSFNDILTDFTGDSVHVDADGTPAESYCHKGIFKASKYILKQLQQHSVLDKAFKDYPNYRFILAGHSLGAGVATMIGVQLKSKYPKLRVYSFSPPGGTVSRELARYTESFVLSVVIGDDVVPRLGLAQLDELKRHMLQCLMETDKPKHKIMFGGLNSLLCKSRNRKITPRMTGSPTAKYKEKKQRNIEKILKKLEHISKEQRKKKREIHLPKNCNGVLAASVVDVGVQSLTEHKLFPPGKILYLTESHEGFEACWAMPEYFDHVIISHHMLTDHLPDVSFKALKFVADIIGERL